MASKRKQDNAFEEFEGLLKTKDFGRIRQGFLTAYEQLEKINCGPSGMGRTRKARKAMKAIEKVMDLFRTGKK